MMPQLCLAGIDVSAAPCVVCGTLGGKLGVQGGRPARTNLSRFGVEGVGCNSCYGKLFKALQHSLYIPPPKAPKVFLPVHPCDECGELGGAIGKKRTRPTRYSLEPFDLVGVCCFNCYQVLNRKRKTPPKPAKPLPPLRSAKPFVIEVDVERETDPRPEECAAVFSGNASFISTPRHVAPDRKPKALVAVQPLDRIAADAFGRMSDAEACRLLRIEWRKLDGVNYSPLPGMKASMGNAFRPVGLGQLSDVFKEAPI